jgi:hypothetical protein
MQLISVFSMAIFRFFLSLFESENASVEYRKIEPTLRFDPLQEEKFTHEFVKFGLLDLKTKKVISSPYYEIHQGNIKGVEVELGNLHTAFIKAQYIKNFPSE